MARVLARRKANALGLNPLEVNAYEILKKYEQLILNEDKLTYASMGRGNVPASRIDKLVKVGVCRIDQVGQSTFAVFVGGST